MRHRLPIAVLVAIVLALGACYQAGSSLSAPAQREIGPAPPDLGAVDVDVAGLRGWFVPAAEGAPCVLLMHGVRTDRRSMIGRARLLQEAGYASLLFDFQAHGESPGERITFGHLESADAHAAVALLRTRFECAKVAAIGQSLGGAAALLGDRPIDVDALVLESVYPTIDEAVAGRLRMRLGPAGAWLTPLLTLQLGPRLGIDRHALRPVDAIRNFHRPVLIMSGTHDRHTRIDEARRLYDAANPIKVFWAVPGAAHSDLQHFARQEYQARLLAFLKRHL